MSNISIVIEERPADIGNFLVGRLLPFRGKRMVGPFIFIDHMGPAALKDHQNIDIGPHPHIGLSTLTYLFEGNILHKDTLGMEVEIKPGQVNWMTAGKGIVHSERTPVHLRHTDKQLHGLQIWVALPRHLEGMEPAFYHADEPDLPAWEKDGVAYKLIAGSAFGRTSPVPVFSELFLLEIKSGSRVAIELGDDLFGEAGMYILEGSVETEGVAHEPRRILVAKDSKLCGFVMEAHTTIYIFGGVPFPEERFIYWNFVASDATLIDGAKKKWENGEFPEIPGETDLVPLPPENPALKHRY
ncbi:pirin family protein [Hufsiella ginkgonis]|uniref:Pirin family protein n=1 Tax=Hufsiella ginkgonis TaxID=2695274 RepID=A0A7K1Y219_9SPHI|nr:pirin family protein [Hufsiella ginkgonis]MXV17304.1 pirin family protein [Hufsiella ginkgonis]